MVQCTNCGRSFANEEIIKAESNDMALCQECFALLKHQLEIILTNASSPPSLTFTDRAIATVIGAVIWGTAGFLLTFVIREQSITMIGVIVGAIVGIKGGIAGIISVILNTIYSIVVGALTVGLVSGFLWWFVNASMGNPGAIDSLFAGFMWGGLAGAGGGLIFALLAPILGKTLAGMVVGLFFALINLDPKAAIEEVRDAVIELTRG